MPPVTTDAHPGGAFDPLYIARHSSHTPDLAHCAQYPSRPVQVAVAFNPHTPTEALWMLSTGLDALVRAVAGLQLLQRLAPDAETLVVAAGLWLRSTGDLTETVHPSTVLAMAKHQQS